MALSTTSKAAIRLYLGRPDLFRYEDTRLESVMDTVSPEAETQIVALITKLNEVDAKIVDYGLTVLGLRRVDEVWFNVGTNPVFNAAKAIGRSLVNKLSIILGVPPLGDYYGSTGYPGDTYTWGGGVPSGNGGGRGGPINLG